MTTTNPTLLAMPIAENGQKNTIPATQAAAGDGLLSQSTGFPPETALPLGAGGKAPTREDFNGAFNLLSDIAFYAQKGWFFQFDDTQAYFAGCVVRDTTDGVLYEAINDVAAGGDVPSSDSDNWKKFFPVGKTIGEIFPHAGTTQPPGALLCNGAAVSRTMYPDLFDEIGTTYGAGDGSTTFNLPNIVEKVIEGDITSGTVKAAGLPNITGNTHLRKSYYSGDTATTIISPTGAFSSTDGTASSVHYNSLAVQDGNDEILFLDASRSSAIYGNSDTVQPPALTMKYYIQAFNASTDPALVDLTQIVQDLTNKLTREQTPAFNRRDVITTSGTYTAPVTGCYRIVVKGGGGGGQGGSISSPVTRGGFGGGEGGTTIAYEKMTAGQTAAVVIGAGGSGGAGGGVVGGAGGDSTVTINATTYTGGGGQGGNAGTRGGTGTIPGASGGSYDTDNSGATTFGGAGGGNGGGCPSGVNGVDGGGGAGGNGQASPTAGGKGGDGFVWFELFDPSLM